MEHGGRTRSVGLALGVFFAVALPSMATDSWIVQNGRARAQIVTADEPVSSVKLAAAELQNYIRKISGATLPIRTTDGEPLARHITRVEAFAGRSEVQLTHTLVLTRDSNEVWFRDIGWELTVHPGPAPRARFGISRHRRNNEGNRSRVTPPGLSRR